MIAALREAQGRAGWHQLIRIRRICWYVVCKHLPCEWSNTTPTAWRLAQLLEIASYSTPRPLPWVGEPPEPCRWLASSDARVWRGGQLSSSMPPWSRPAPLSMRCGIPYIAPSLGGAQSLVEQPALMSYYEMDPTEDRQANWGLFDGLVRYALPVLKIQNDLLATMSSRRSKYVRLIHSVATATVTCTSGPIPKFARATSGAREFSRMRGSTATPRFRLQAGTVLSTGVSARALRAGGGAGRGDLPRA